MATLYHVSLSPFCRKVRVVLHETGQMADVEIVPAKNSPMVPDETNKAQNPLGKIPTLIRADGPAIYDSRVICRYLDARAGGKLYPERRIWETLTLEATADGILDAAVLMVYEGRFRDEPLRSKDWLEAQWMKIDRALDALESRWMSHLHGKLDMGQIAVACALGYLDLRHGDRDWRGKRPSLSAWYRTFAARPSMEATVPPA